MNSTPPGRVPDFFLVGHQKSGTTAMHLMLDQHPDVFMPAVKEPRYFATDLRSRFQGEAGPGRPQTLEAYMALFAAARADQLVGDASATYLRSKVAAQGIAQAQPQARIVAVLREPASYIRSLHLQLLASNVESERELRRALALEDERREGRSVPAHTHHPEALLYSEHVRYVEQLRRFHDAFGRERVLVLVYEDFKRDNRAVFKEMLRFLDLDDAQVEIEPVRTKPVREARSVLAHRAVNRVRLAKRAPERVGPLARAVATLIPAAARSQRFGARWRRALYADQKPPDEELMSELRERFRPEVEALSEYLDRDMIARWGYGVPA
jgi:hypothetical protein